MHASDHLHDNPDHSSQTPPPNKPGIDNPGIDPETGEELPPDDSACMFAMLCHLAAFAGLIVPFGNALGPFILWLIKRRDHPFIERQGRESLNFQITIILVSLIFGFLSFFWAMLLPPLIILLAPLLISGGVLLAVYAAVMTIIAATKAYQGIDYEYPLKINLVKSDTFDNL
jgi:hypothetical protein